jgi:hypothetical protein
VWLVKHVPSSRGTQSLCNRMHTNTRSSVCHHHAAHSHCAIVRTDTQSSMCHHHAAHSHCAIVRSHTQSSMCQLTNNAAAASSSYSNAAEATPNHQPEARSLSRSSSTHTSIVLIQQRSRGDNQTSTRSPKLEQKQQHPNKHCPHTATQQRRHPNINQKPEA